MNTKTQLTVADAIDRFLQLVVLSLFFLAIMFGLYIAEHFTTGAAAEVIEWMTKIVAVLIVATILGAFFWKSRRIPNDAESRSQVLEGFLQGAFQQALAKSWMFLFLVLALLATLDNLILSRLPEFSVEIVLYSILMLMLLSVCILFVLLSRAPATND